MTMDVFAGLLCIAHGCMVALGGAALANRIKSNLGSSCLWAFSVVMGAILVSAGCSFLFGK